MARGSEAGSKVRRHGGGTLRGSQAALRGDRRRRHERPRAGGPRARRRGHRLGPRRVLVLGAPAGGGDRARARATTSRRPREPSWWCPPPSPRTTRSWSAARAAGVAVLHRGDLLGEVSALKRTIAVAGTHGKTTTASMAALALVDAGRDPAFLIGGELRALGTNAGWGAGDWAVVEADESDRSFLKLVARGGGRHQRRARPSRHLPVARRARARLRELRGPGRAGRARPRRASCRRACRRLSYGIDSGDLRAERLELLPLGSRFAWRAWRWSWRCRAATTC